MYDGNDECNFEARGCVYPIYGGGGAEFSQDREIMEAIPTS